MRAKPTAEWSVRSVRPVVSDGRAGRPARPETAPQAVPCGRRDRKGRVIGAWKRVLVLAPHTDDGEFGAGGTMARLVEEEAEVRYVAFSIATRSLPEGFAPDTLAREVKEATAELGIRPENLTVHDFDVRTFPEHRQDILELLVALWRTGGRTDHSCPAC